MGDRGNIIIRSEGEQVSLYSHWGGSELKEIVAKGLDRGRDRWKDPSYLTRILFDTLTEGQHGQTIGFGISQEPGDNSHPFVIVDCIKQAVYLEADKRAGFDILPENEADLLPVPFEEWVKKYTE